MSGKVDRVMENRRMRNKGMQVLLVTLLAFAVLCLTPVAEADAPPPTVMVISPDHGTAAAPQKVSPDASGKIRVRIQVWNDESDITAVSAGYCLSSTDPANPTNWTWVAASVNVKYNCGTNCGIYEADITLAAGSSYYLQGRAASAEDGNGYSSDSRTGNDAKYSCIAVNANDTGTGMLLKRDASSRVCMDCHNLPTHSSQHIDTGYGNWGIACSECHTPHETTNIMVVRNHILTPNSGSKDVVFWNRTGDAPKSFVDSTAGTPQGVCEVCHTQTRGPGAIARWRNTGNADSHYDASSGTQPCTACHPHSGGFQPSCSACHGYPPVTDTAAAPDGLVWNPSATGSMTGTAHVKHATAGNNYSFTCETCHCSGMPVTAISGNNRIQIGFNLFGGAIPGTGTTYKGQTLAPPYSYEYTNGTLEGATTFRCTNVYCHGNYSGSGKNAAPAWNDASSGACSTCHEATNTTPPDSGSHGKHAVSDYYNFQCTLCHGGIVSGSGQSGYSIADTSRHVNRYVDWNFSTDPRAAGGMYGIPSGTAVPSNGTTPRAYGSCTNVYCHSNVQPANGIGGPSSYKNPEWGSGLNTCNDCHTGGHGNPTSTGSHSAHLSYTFTTGNDAYKCVICHSWDNTQSLNCSVCHNFFLVPEYGKHANYQIEVVFDPAFNSSAFYSQAFTPGNGFSSCSNTYCHSNGTSVATGSIPSNSSPQWASASLSCNACHSFPPGYTNGSPKANTHAKHDDYTCNNCHNTTTNNGSSISSKTTHVNKQYTVDPGTGRTFSYAYAASGGTCSNISCHFGGTATWGGTVSCGDCHAATAETLTTGGHGTHLSTSVVRGPNSVSVIVTCDTCHGTGASSGTHSGHGNGTVSFADGNVLASTASCNSCHSPGGTYDGVNNVVYGARANWGSGVYEGNSLKAGKEKWCAGCHDEAASVIAGMTAPNVIGDEDGLYSYGTGWGYYRTGHGLKSGTYPASGAPAAKKECSDCHNYSKVHIDGQHRTYTASSDNYQAGYRLTYNMDIPRTDVGEPVSDFAVCFSCHDSDLYLNSSNSSTNFREGATGNSHYLHLQSPPTGQFAGSGWWDSDWDGSTGDSKISCPACHNVHGSPSPRMMRHGELISTPGTTDKVPALNFKYTPSGSFPTLMESSGGELDPPSPGGGTIGNTGVCSMCHSNQEGYTRTPNDMYPPQITGVYGKVGSNILTVVFSKGVYTDTGASGDLFAGDFTYNDSDNGRTVSGVTHTAGDDFAILTLSAALDASNDIGVDTVAAATASSIYDAADQAMATTPVAVTGDATAPVLADQSPADGATDIAIDSSLTFTLSDSDAGVDWSSLQIQLSGDKGYSKTYTDLDTFVVSKTGSMVSYSVTVNPDANFGNGEVITVTVNVSDYVGNAATPPAWSFTTQAAATPQTITLYPSGLASNPGGYWTVPVADQWATYLDANDGDSMYVTSNTGSAGAIFYMDIDNPGLSEGTIQNLTFHVLARYVSGWAPSPPCYDGNINIGYKTGASTVWKGDTAVSGCSYNDVSSVTYTTDSDAGPLDLTDINNLQIAVNRRTSGGYPLRITQIYVVVTYLP